MIDIKQLEELDKLVDSKLQSLGIRTIYQCIYCGFKCELQTEIIKHIRIEHNWVMSLHGK